MRPINTVELIHIWERGRNCSPTEKALLLLGTACSDGDPEDPALLDIGDRDIRLLQLREWMFGSQLLNISSCPQCNEYIEWINEVAELRLPQPARNSFPLFSLKANDYHIQFRLPNSYDLSGNENKDPKKILSGCIVEIEKNNVSCEVTDLPDEVFDLLDERMAEENPQADIRMRLSCPACSHVWEAKFDMIGYLWKEIDSCAKRILHEVAVLAAKFGWSESQVFALSPYRRQLYLEMIDK